MIKSVKSKERIKIYSQIRDKIFYLVRHSKAHVKSFMDILSLIDEECLEDIFILDFYED